MEPDLLGDSEVDAKMRAASLKMFGKLTQEKVDWYPDKLLSRRFNVPPPYPE